MKPAILFRVAAVLYLLFAIGHTFGFLTFKPPTEEAQAVRESMNTVHFVMQDKILSYGGFYRGFGLAITGAILLQAFFCWYLGSMARHGNPAVVPLGSALFAQQLASQGLSWLYFGLPPVILGTIVAIILALATWLAQTRPPQTRPARPTPVTP